MSYRYLSYLSLTIKMSHNPGDKSVTMCGIAQEWEEYTKTLTRPWHVTVETINQVSLMPHFHYTVGLGHARYGLAALGLNRADSLHAALPLV